MRRPAWNLLAALLIVAPALALVQVDAMRGAGSPDWDAGHPRSLTQFTTGAGCGTRVPCSPVTNDPAVCAPACPSAAVYYPGNGFPIIPAGALNTANTAFNPACASSPQCIPNLISLSQASPWFGTPPPSGTYRVTNPCGAAPGNEGALPLPLDYYDNPDHYPLIKPGQWTQLESVTNTQTSPLTYFQVDSVGNTPWNGALGSLYHNQFSNPPGTGYGDGRYHLSNETLTQGVFDRVELTNVLFTANPDPSNFEGAPDTRSTFTGHDGYALGRFEQPVFDVDGFDFQVNIVATGAAPYSTLCAYGATSPRGPFTLVHSGYTDPNICDRTFKTTMYCPPPLPATACPGTDDCFPFDLSIWYTPLRQLRGEPNPGQLDYLLLVNSMTKTPYLKGDFTIERITAAPMTPAGLAPLRQDALFYFNDTSVRFGHPLWASLTDTHEDPISEWNWDFSSDPYSVARRAPVRPDRVATLPPLPLLTNAPAEKHSTIQSTSPADHNVTHRYISPGIFQACQSVHTTDQILGGTLIVWRQSDPPASDPPPPSPLPPLPSPLHFRQPDPRQVPLVRDMHCKPLTVNNLPPTPLFSYGATWEDPQRIRFYDVSQDTDWIMPPMPFPENPAPGTTGDYGPCVKPPEPFAYNRCNLPRGPSGVEGCCACPDCPPDGIQMRSWDFTSDGVVDHSWYYRAQTRNDLRYCTADTVNPAQPPLICPQDPTTGVLGICPPFPPPPPAPPTPAVPYCGQPGDPFLVQSGSFGFVDADCHEVPRGARNAWIYGPGIPPDTTIVSVLSARVVRISNPVFADVDLGKAAGVPFVVACPYDELVDNPGYTYPRPGQYEATLRVCDHDWVVRMSPTAAGTQIWGSKAWPNPFQRQWSLEGDPFGAATGIAPNPSPFTTMGNATITPGTALPREFHNLHACEALRQVVRIPNMPPFVSVPPTIVVRPHQQVTFTVVGTDTDRGQTLTLRPCPGLEMFPGMSFPATSAAVPRVERTVSFNVGAIAFGQYGPFCFEVCDDYGACVHAVMALWVSGVTTDTDADGITDLADNCPSVPNRDQLDGNGDGVGDACQHLKTSFLVTPPELETFDTVDHDGDGIDDQGDNCPSVPNHFQEDMEGDGVGDVCDMDADGDGVVSANDNCPTVPNPLQEDANKDGLGNACATLGAGKGLLDRPKGDPVTPETVADPAFGMVLGSALGLLAMLAILVPLLLFALRRTDGKGRDGQP